MMQNEAQLDQVELHDEGDAHDGWRSRMDAFEDNGSASRLTSHGRMLFGQRWVLERGKEGYPLALENVTDPPKRLYGIGDPASLQEGLAVVGARKATPYGTACARRFAGMAAAHGVVVVSGGAYGCDAEAHRAALAAGTPTVVFLGGGCDELYPAAHASLFQRIIDGGGAVVSEHSWNQKPRPYMFRMRNRLIAGLAKAVLIVEAGLPSGTFSTADEALSANRDVLVVPGAITSETSRGANRLISQGAVPIIDDESFEDALFTLFGCLKTPSCEEKKPDQKPRRRKKTTAGIFVEEFDANSLQELCAGSEVVLDERAARPLKDDRCEHAKNDPVLAALQAEPLGMDGLYEIARESCGSEEPHAWLMERLVDAEGKGLVARYANGKWGPA